MADEKFVQQAVAEGIKDIISAYGEAIDKFVTDPDIRFAIKASAGKGILVKLFERLKNAGTQEATKGQEETKGEEEKKEEQAEADPHSWPLGGLTTWPDERF